jgi:tetratricopeptide (TPR) repeat protein
MLIGLGVSWYARGSYERAAQYLGSASDLAPGDETPYLFMGRMQSEETVPSQETLARLARFQRLEPGNALANYYYAVSLWKWKQSTGALDDASSAEVEALLQKAIQIDLRLGAAQLQLGILYALRGDYPRAIPAYQKAVEISPELEEAHYRLAQAYKRNGEEARAQKELQIHEQLAKQAKEQAERERNEIQQFVISLRDGTGQER